MNQPKKVKKYHVFQLRLQLLKQFWKLGMEKVFQSMSILAFIVITFLVSKLMVIQILLKYIHMNMKGELKLRF